MEALEVVAVLLIISCATTAFLAAMFYFRDILFAGVIALGMIAILFATYNYFGIVALLGPSVVTVVSSVIVAHLLDRSDRATSTSIEPSKLPAIDTNYPQQPSTQVVLYSEERPTAQYLPRLQPPLKSKVSPFLSMTGKESLLLGAVIDCVIGLIIVFIVGLKIYIPFGMKLLMAAEIALPFYLWGTALFSYHVPLDDCLGVTFLGERVPSGPDGKGRGPGYYWFPLGPPFYKLVKNPPESVSVQVVEPEPPLTDVAKEILLRELRKRPED